MALVLTESTFIFPLCNHTWSQAQEHSFCLLFSTNIPLTSIFLKGKKSVNLSFGKTAKCGSGLGFLPLLLCFFCLGKLRPSCNPHSLIWRSPGLAGKASQEGKGDGRQTGTALGCDVLVCNLFCSQAPRPPKDKESIRQWGAWLRDLWLWRMETWQWATQNCWCRRTLCQISAFQCPVSWISTWRCLSSLDSDLFPRALKHSKTPVLPERIPYASEDFEYFLIFPS